MTEQWQWTVGFLNNEPRRQRTPGRGRGGPATAIGAACLEALEQRRLLTVAPGLFDLDVMPTEDGDVVVSLAGPSPADPGVMTPPPIGPNHFGYTARATDFEDIDVGAGDAAGLHLTGDDAFDRIPLNGNSFNFYGRSYTGNELWASTNGHLTFLSGSGLFLNGDLSGGTQSAFHAAILPLWDDWLTEEPGAEVVSKFDGVHPDGTSDRLIVQWNHVRHFGNANDTVTFQAILELNTGSRPGSIVFNYPDLDVDTDSNSNSAVLDTVHSGGGTATVGIQNDPFLGDDPLLSSDPLLISFGDNDGERFGTPPRLSDLVGTRKAIRISANEPPTAVDDSVPAKEDTAVEFNVLANDTDPDGDALTVSDFGVPAHGTLQDLGGGNFRYTPSAGFSGIDGFDYTVSDGQETDGGSVNITVAGVADAPTLTIDAVSPVSEPGVIPLRITAASTDADGSETVSVRITGVPVGAALNKGTLQAGGAWLLTPADLPGLALTAGDDAAGTLHVTATATEGSTSASTPTKDVAVSVLNVAPTVVLGLPASDAQFAKGTAIELTGNFTDPGLLDTHTGVWTLTSNSSGQTVTLTQAGTVTGNTVTTTVNDAAHPLAAGVYQLKLTVTDDDGGAGVANTIGGTAATIVVFDATAGFVGGVGWFNSPAGALSSSPTWTGRAQFAFLSGYRPGTTTPFGAGGFLLKAGASTFKTTAYDWVVVSGYKAQYRGTGTVNGVAGYRFLVTVIDGKQAGGGGVDRIRLKVWSDAGVWYDNQAGAGDDANPLTALGGGNIVIVS
jgi:hypothetical protein